MSKISKYCNNILKKCIKIIYCILASLFFFQDFHWEFIIFTYHVTAYSLTHRFIYHVTAYSLTHGFIYQIFQNFFGYVFHVIFCFIFLLKAESSCYTKKISNNNNRNWNKLKSNLSFYLRSSRYSQIRVMCW